MRSKPLPDGKVPIPVSGHLVYAVRDGRPLRATGDDALRAYRFIEAILSASR